MWLVVSSSSSTSGCPRIVYVRDQKHTDSRCLWFSSEGWDIQSISFFFSFFTAAGVEDKMWCFIAWLKARTNPGPRITRRWTPRLLVARPITARTPWVWSWLIVITLVLACHQNSNMSTLQEQVFFFFSFSFFFFCAVSASLQQDPWHKCSEVGVTEANLQG